MVATYLMIIFLKIFALFIRSLPRKPAIVIGILLGKLLGIILIGKKKICYLNLDLAYSRTLSSKEKNRIIKKMYVNLLRPRSCANSSIVANIRYGMI